MGIPASEPPATAGTAGGPPLADAGPAAVDPLVTEATRKSGLVWVTVPGERARPVWHLWHEGSAYLVTGGVEQPLPAMPAGGTVTVTARSKDNRARVVSWSAAVAEIPPETPEWAAIAPLLQAERLNAPDGDAAPARWARECTLWRLTPTGEQVETPGTMPTGSGAAAPPPSPATSRVPLPFQLRLPFRLGRRRSR